MKVFVIGSGFSASLGLPTLINIFEQIMAVPERRGESDKENIYNALEILYPHFRRSDNPSTFPPLEEFISLVDLAQNLPFINDNDHWAVKRLSTLRLLTDYLAKKSAIAENDELLNSFVSKLADGDVIITFNWDNLIETAIHKQKRNISFKNIEDDHAITLLKLHGSLNWLQISNDVSFEDPNSVTWLAERICHTKDYSYFDPWDTLNKPPYIVPPTVVKNPPSSEFLGVIWDKAFQALIKGEKIFIIGYSVPEYDLQARTLLVTGLHWRSSGHRKYFVLDPNPNIGGKYFSLINPEVEFYQDKFSLENLNLLF